MKYGNIFVADFETTTNPEDCRVWAWGIANIMDPENVAIGNTIQSFYEYVKELPFATIYFHNLKFDGGFLLDYWLKSGYKHSQVKSLNPKEFNSLISDTGQWYTLKQKYEVNECGFANEIEFRDSLKIIPLPIEAFPATFGLEEHKLELDYTADREQGHILTKHEEDYLKADVIILAKAIAIMVNQGFTKLTCGSNAYNNYKSMCPDFKRWFPEIEKYVDADIRKSYKGGWTYLNPSYKNKPVENGCVYDVNSMYPWAMMYCKLPYGKPIRFTGEYKQNAIYDLYVVELECEFKLKPGKFPSIQIKHSVFYNDTEYLEHSTDITTLILTSVDLELFFECYDVKVYEWNGGYMFKSKVGMFTDYINYWYGQKTKAKEEGNKGLEFIAKRMLNSLYGKYGTRGEGRSKIPYLGEDNRVRYKLSELEERKAGYVPVAAFITSYCRDKIIRSANSVGERFIYADTDSIHILGQEEPAIDIDEYRLGAFKKESEFIRAKFIRQKTYMEIEGAVDINGNRIEKKNVKCAGMPKSIQKRVTEEDFCEGAIFDGKLLPQIVAGGVILKETTFEIKRIKGK